MQPTMIQVGTGASPSSAACDAYFYYSGFTNPTSCPGAAVDEAVSAPQEVLCT